MANWPGKTYLMPAVSRPCPKTWQVLLALSLVYASWGTTYLAIHEGVKTLPPGLFGGVRVTCAGLVLLAYLMARRQFVLLPARDLFGAFVVTALRRRRPCP